MPSSLKFIFVFYLVFQLLFISSFAQLPVYWSKNIGGSNNDNRAITQLTADGGIILLGNSRSSDGDLNFPGHGGTEAVMIKMDSCGNVQWKKKFGGSGDDLGYSLVITPDGGYAFGGMTNSNDGDAGGVHGVFDLWIVKTDAAGNIQWKRTIGGGNSDILGFIAAHPNGNIIVFGQTTSGDGDLTGIPPPENTTGPTGSDGWITCLGNNGITLWQKKIGTTGFEATGQVIIAPDGNIVGCGTTPADPSLPLNSQSSNAWVFKIDVTNGNMIWNKNFGGSQSEGAYTVAANPAGEFVVGCIANSSNGDVSVNYGSSDAWVLKLSADGNLIWQLPIGGTGPDRSWDVVFLPDQSIILCGETNSTNASFLPVYGQGDAFLARITSAGQLLWKQNYGGSLPDILFNIRPLNEDVFIASGISGSSDHDLAGNHGVADLWLIKLRNKPVSAVDTTVCNRSIFNGITINSDTIIMATLKDGCGYDSAYINYTITVSKPDVKTINDTTIQAGQAITLYTTASGNVAWEPELTLSCLNCNNPVATPVITTAYIVKTGAGSCIATDTVKITVEGKEEIYIPSAFSPNDDGLNDIFKASGAVVSFTMQIYNRWGNLVFSSRNITQGWNGFYKGKKQPAGNFVYVVTYTNAAGKQKLLKGNLFLIK